METNLENHQNVVNEVYELKQKALTGNENEKEEAIAKLHSIMHFHLGLSGIANNALKEAGQDQNLQIYKDVEIAKHKANTGKVVLQIAIVAILFYLFAKTDQAWYWSLAKAIGLYIAAGWAIFLTGGVKYFKKRR